MAKIVFADGSKNLAHSLDDQYERWRMRREYLRETQVVLPETDLELLVPELPDLSEFDKATLNELVKILTAQQLFFQEKIISCKLKLQKGELSKGEVEFIRRPLALAVTRVNAQIFAVRRYLEAAGVVERRANLKALKTPLQNAQREATETVNRLKEKEADGSITFAERIKLEQAKFTSKDASLEGHARKVANAQTPEEAAMQRNEYENQLVKEISRLREKLIFAYERIIELQSRE